MQAEYKRIDAGMEMEAIGSVAEPPRRPGLTIVGCGDGRGEIGRIAFDHDGIAHERLVDDGDTGHAVIFDLDMNGDEMLENDATTGGVLDERA